MDNLENYRVEIDIAEFDEDTPVTGSGFDGLTVSDVEPIGDCSLTPGDASPVGRCPHSGDLVYLDRQKDRIRDAAEEMLSLLEKLLAPGSASGSLIEQGRDLLAKLGRDVRGAQSAWPAAIEIPKVLELSTAHISEETDSNFRLMTDDVPRIFYPKTSGSDGTQYGWIIPIGPEIEWSHMVSADLVAIRKVAEENGCTWIMLDRDGDQIDGLDVYEW